MPLLHASSGISPLTKVPLGVPSCTFLVACSRNAPSGFMLPTKLGVAGRPLTSNVLFHARGPCNAPIRFSSTSSTPFSKREPLALGSHRGTVPFHETLAIVHTDIPPTNWPSKVQPVLPLYPELQAYARNFHGIVNVAYFPNTSSRAGLKSFPSAASSSPDSPLDSTRSTGNPALPKAAECSHQVTMFAGGNKVIEFPRVRLQDAERVYRDLYRGLLDEVPVSGLGAIVKAPSNNYGVSHIFVCTHAARDCRCGTTGVDVFNAISNAIAGHPAWSRLGIQMGEVAHVGGHK